MKTYNYAQITDILQNFPVHWDGKSAICEMKNNDFKQWRQMEWIGFYFEYLCKKELKELFQFPGPKYGKVSFDGFYQIPFDFKSHAINTSSHQIIVNDKNAVMEALNEYNKVGLILALGEVVYNIEVFKSGMKNLKVDSQNTLSKELNVEPGQD